MPSDAQPDLPKDQLGAAAATEPASPPAPPEAVSPAKEWGAAIVLMIVFALIASGFMSVFRGG